MLVVAGKPLIPKCMVESESTHLTETVLSYLQADSADIRGCHQMGPSCHQRGGGRRGAAGKLPVPPPWPAAAATALPPLPGLHPAGLRPVAM